MMQVAIPIDRLTFASSALDHIVALGWGWETWWSESKGLWLLRCTSAHGAIQVEGNTTLAAANAAITAIAAAQQPREGAGHGE